MILAYAGQACLGVALLLSGFQAFGPARLSSRLSLGHLSLITLAFGILLHAHMADQFGFLSVALHSHTQKPMLYKIAGVWGNHEGSMLLWTLILSIYNAVAVRQVKALELPYALVAPIMGFITFAFVLFLVMACDPFAVTNPIPFNGQDLNPLLQDPALALHPPILYMGYVGFAVPFAFSVAALIQGNVPESWPTLVRPWILWAWSLLTLGVGLGSVWAYYELGWGGWWFWDPVENAALLPWLTATTLTHTVIALKAANTGRAGTFFLTLLTFTLCLVGVFLVRSSLITSVHNFALDPERGIFLFLLSCFLTLPAFGLWVWRLPAFRSAIPVIPLSRAGLIALMTLILLTGATTVALGTFYPLVLEFLGQKMTVGLPYFQVTFIPMMLPLLLLIGAGPWYTWTKQGLPSSSARWLLPLGCLTLASVLILSIGLGVRHILGLTALAGAIWIILTTGGYALKKRKILSGTILSHLGIGIAILGMVGSSLGEKEILKAVKIGEMVTVGPLSVTLQQVALRQGPNYRAQRATLHTDRGETLLPERRFYWTQGVIHGESAIHSTGFGKLHHIYVTLGEGYEGEKWSIHAYYKPFINLLWLGWLLVAIGGVIAFRKRLKGIKKTLAVTLTLWHPILGISAHEQLTDPALEMRARHLGQRILCPTCQGQVLDESAVESAATLRSHLRKALSEGQTDQQILEAFIERYGLQTVVTPPIKKSTYALWFGPWVLFFAVLAGWGWKKRKCR